MSVIGLSAVTTPSTPVSGNLKVWYNSTDKMLKMIDSTGTVFPISNVLQFSSESDQAIANALTSILHGTAYNNQSGYITAGTLLRYTICGSTATIVTAAQTINISYGANNDSSDTAIITFPTFNSANGTNVFKIVIELVIRTIGASATGYATMSLINASTTGIYTATSLIQSGTISTIDLTQGGRYFNVNYNSGSASTTTTFKTVSFEMIRK
jgi:hypothetical protein